MWTPLLIDILKFGYSRIGQVNNVTMLSSTFIEGLQTDDYLRGIYEILHTFQSLARRLIVDRYVDICSVLIYFDVVNLKLYVLS